MTAAHAARIAPWRHAFRPTRRRIVGVIAAAITLPTLLSGTGRADDLSDLNDPTIPPPASVPGDDTTVAPGDNEQGEETAPAPGPDESGEPAPEESDGDAPPPPEPPVPQPPTQAPLAVPAPAPSPPVTQAPPVAPVTPPAPAAEPKPKSEPRERRRAKRAHGDVRRSPSALRAPSGRDSESAAQGAPLPAAQTSGPDASPGSVATTAAQSAAPTEAGADGEAHVVRSGESLWSIARAMLGPRASAAQTAVLVDRIWQLNQRRIHSGQPDLIQVGETLVLPHR